MLEYVKVEYERPNPNGMRGVTNLFKNQRYPTFKPSEYTASSLTPGYCCLVVSGVSDAKTGKVIGDLVSERDETIPK